MEGGLGRLACTPSNVCTSSALELYMYMCQEASLSQAIVKIDGFELRPRAVLFVHMWAIGCQMSACGYLIHWLINISVAENRLEMIFCWSNVNTKFGMGLFVYESGEPL